MNTDEIICKLIAAAYHHGWRNACDDHLQQKSQPGYPIGQGKRDANELLVELDPHNLLGLRATMEGDA